MHRHCFLLSVLMAALALPRFAVANPEQAPSNETSAGELAGDKGSTANTPTFVPVSPDAYRQKFLHPPGLLKLPVFKLKGETYNLTPILHYLEDPTGELTMVSVWKRLDEFKPVPKGSANFGLSKSAYWFIARVDLPKETGSWILNFPYAPLDSIRVYSSHYKGPQAGGDLLPFSERYKEHRTANFEVPASDEREVEWIIYRIQTETSVQAESILHSSESFSLLAAEENAGLYLYYGIFLVMVLFNGALFLQLRDNVYLPYIGYLITQPLFHMCMNGSFAQRFLPNAPAIASPSLAFFGLSSLAFTLFFAVSFNQLQQRMPRFSNIALTLAKTYIALSVLAYFIPYKFVVLPLVLGGIVIPAIDLYCGVVAWRAGYRPARFYVIGWGVFVILTIATGLKAAGILPSNFITVFGGQIGSALEAILFTVALGDRMRDIVSERDQLNERLLHQTSKLAEESTRRADAESEARIAAESKIALFSHAVHHLNNRLSHIRGSTDRIGELAGVMQTSINDLLHTDPVDPDAEKVRQGYNGQFEEILESLSDATTASNRATDTVKLLRVVSGIDGPSIAPTSLGELTELAGRRIGDTLGKKLEALGAESGSVKLIGHPALYAQAMEMVGKVLNDHSIGLDSLHIEEATPRSKLILALEATLSSEAQEHFTRVEALVDHLLEPYGCSVHLNGNRIILELANELPSS